ncbi:MAG: ATP synthase F1 subunit epsilon [Candidatus Hydrogenedentes bacterium]|nr:ATP synthase F1 subunit epsilon [Candidatus Hydrogenedentota bacterium]
MPGPYGDSLSLEISALDREPVRIEVADVSLPGTEGVFTVLPGHAPMVATITIGVLTATLLSGIRHSFAVSGGLVHVIQNKVLVLTQTAEMDTEIDLDRAEAARQRAEQELNNAKGTADVAFAEVALKRAIIRIRARRGESAGA